MAKVETERFFGKKGIIIMIRDGNKMVSAIFKDKKNADKFNRNNPSDVKKLLQLAKKTKFPKAIDEDTDVGHQDDEPNMLKSTALEIMEYGKKLMDKLDKYDDMEGEVDFPNWWQSKLTLAKDYLQKAYHYLDSEEKTSENIDRNFRSYDNDEEVEEGFASDAQRRAAFASGYKAKGKKGKKKNEAYLVAYGKREGNKSIKPAFAAYADKKLAQRFMNSMKKDGYKVMMTQKKIRGIDESYLEEASKLAMGIAGFTGTRGIAVDDFIKKNKIDARKLFNFVKKGNLKDRMAFVAAIAGRPNNKMFKMIVGRFAESVNEAKSMDMKKRLKVYDKLKKGDKVTIKYGTSMRSGIENEFVVSKGKTKVGKERVERISLKSVKNPSGVKYYLYQRNRNVTMAQGDMAANIEDMHESINEDAPCWDTHKQVGMKMKNGKQVPNCVPKGESVVKEDKNQIIQLKKKVGKSEIKFYDALSKIEKKLGKKNYRVFLEKGLKDFKLNPKHYDYRSNGAAEEKLFNLAK